MTTPSATARAAALRIRCPAVIAGTYMTAHPRNHSSKTAKERAARRPPFQNSCEID
jgi:hypothetical protein